MVEYLKCFGFLIPAYEEGSNHLIYVEKPDAYLWKFLKLSVRLCLLVFNSFSIERL